MTKLPILAATCLLAVAITGCASKGNRCGEANYLGARSVAPIQGVDGLSLPESPSALRVPPLSEAAQSAAAQAPAVGSGKRACLDWPPELPASEAPPAAQ